MPVRKRKTPLKKTSPKISQISPKTHTPKWEGGITRNQIVQQLARSAHGDLKQYTELGREAAEFDPEFFAHLIAWNEKNGQIRDARVALPVVSLSKWPATSPFVENSLAHLALLDPRLLNKAVHYAKEVRTKGNARAIIRVVERYLREREKSWGWWERSALQHRDSMKSLYAFSHTKPNAMAQQILFDKNYPKGTIFYEVAHLKEKSPLEIAGTIMKKHIPFLVAHTALGEKMKDESVVLALINEMSPTEIVTNTKMLEKLGIQTRPALRAAYEEALGRVASSKKTTFKATRAAEAISDTRLKKKLEEVQEKQIQTLGGIDGDWLVLGDKSGSMEQAIEASRVVSGTLAKLVKGMVHLVFFDVTPTYYPVSNLPYTKILKKTQHVRSGGGTSIGCGLLSIMERNIEVDGIAIVSDGEENTPPYFHDVYRKYCAKFGKDVPVYLYLTAPSARGWTDQALSSSMKAAGMDMQVFDLRGSGVDYYSLPNLVQTMRASRYSLADEILSTPLVSLDEAFKKKAA